ncbi:hypothetical protein ES703_17413 [subsurface metagenome]
MATEIEILGHKAKIERVSSVLKLEPWRKEDQLVVWLHFDEDVDGILSFAVSLPVKKYEREEFLYNVGRRGEEVLKRMLERNKEERREREEGDERQKVLDAMAAEAQSLIE